MTTTRRSQGRLYRGSSTTLIGNRARLQRFIEERVVEINAEWRDISAASGISESILRRIRKEHDAGLTIRVARALEKALGWTKNSIDAILAGGQPGLELDAGERRSDPVSKSSLGDVMAEWSSILPDDLYWKMVEDFRALRLAALDYGYRQALFDLGVDHDPREQARGQQQRTTQLAAGPVRTVEDDDPADGTSADTSAATG